MAVDVIFSFDSEDFETPGADEGELWWADALSRHGMAGCFCVVGELARALQGTPERVTLDQSNELPALAVRPDFAGLRFHGGWNMFAPEFQAPHVLQMARLQTWSARLAAAA
ncbi:MAG: hypothetical protein ACR2JY_05300 [Chloroflexota bacterium]